MIRPFSRLFLECCPISLIYYFVCYFLRFLILRNTITSEKTKYRMVKPRELWTSVFLIGGAVTFTLGPWGSLLGRIPDKNDCAFTWGSRGEVMIFFEKNKVLGFWTKQGFEYIRRNLKNKHDLTRAGVKKVSVLVHVYTFIVSSQYVFSYVMSFRIIHFILISTAHALFLTCPPVSIYGT